MAFKLTVQNFLASLLLFIWIIKPVLSLTPINLIFAGCDKNGWRCIPSKVRADKYDLEFDCNITKNAVLSLWNFRAPKEIYGVKMANCSYLEIDLSCGIDGQVIDSLYLYNIEILNLTSAIHPELSYLPSKFVLDSIGRIEKLSPHILKQNMDFPDTLFKCSIQGPPLDTLFFTDIGEIIKIEHHAVNLTEMSWFTWHNVTIREVEPFGINVYMEKDKQFTIKRSSIDKVGYRGITLKAHSIFMNQTDILEIEKYGITATVYWFDFANSKIGVVHPKGFHLLAQNVNIMNNSFSQLEPKAFFGIGPGLLENALVSFGRLRFTYVFSRNKILQANVGSLNPDWEAYKNVKTFLNFTLNHLPCSCTELGWVNLRDGIGGGLADTASFNQRIMEKKSQNMCVDAPCLLPLGVMAIMQFINGSCERQITLKEICSKFINNRDFRMRILTESEKFALKRIPNIIINGDDPMSERLFPVNLVKSNLKKTDFMKDSSRNKRILFNEERVRRDIKHNYNYYKINNDRKFEEIIKKEASPINSEELSLQIFDPTTLDIDHIMLKEHRRHDRAINREDETEIKDNDEDENDDDDDDDDDDDVDEKREEEEDEEEGLLLIREEAKEVVTEAVEEKKEQKEETEPLRMLEVEDDEDIETIKSDVIKKEFETKNQTSSSLPPSTIKKLGPLRVQWKMFAAPEGNSARPILVPRIIGEVQETTLLTTSTEQTEKQTVSEQTDSTTTKSTEKEFVPLEQKSILDKNMILNNMTRSEIKSQKLALLKNLQQKKQNEQLIWDSNINIPPEEKLLEEISMSKDIERVKEGLKNDYENRFPVGLTRNRKF